MNVRKAIPLFEGHYQPRVPLNGNYYCLLDDGVMEVQAELAKKYGIYGFCYYHYWFANGKKLLEKPLERMLRNPNVDIPFCLCWANENWTRRWDGGNNEIIVAQDYDDMDNLNRHIDYLCEFFADPRYIKHDGKPFFIIYRPVLIPDIKTKISYIRERVKQNGFPGIVIALQHPSYMMYGKFTEFGADYYIQFEPLFSDFGRRKEANINDTIKYMLHRAGILNLLKAVKHIVMKPTVEEKHYSVLDYDALWKCILNYKPKDKRLIAGVFKDWDNTPRNRSGVIVSGGTPEKFGKYMKMLIQKVKKEYALPYIFIDAWNEWGEGAYLEPDERYGYEWLEALKNALNS